MWDYSEKVKDHFFHPRNAKVVQDANAIGDVGSISCGDALRLMLKVNPKTEVIEDAGFQTFGCGSAIASSSALTEMIIGKTLTDAQKVTNQDIADYLDGLPPEKMHCSVMGREALDAAIADFRGEEYVSDKDDSPLICKCFGIDENKIVKAIKENNLTTLQEVTNYTKAGGACGSCHEKIEEIIIKTLKAIEDGKNCDAPKKTVGACEAATIASQSQPIERTNHEEKSEDNNCINEALPFYNTVVEIIEQMRPALAQDGGDVKLVKVTKDRVEVELSGACTGCMMTDMTLSWIQQKLMEALGTYIQVVNIAVPNEFINTEIQ
ncbi:MAG: Fe-S cluster assembly protein NifU [Succinivibrionaceae bacterium]